MEFKGRQVLVTGGGKGIGRAVAEHLAKAGATVHIVGRSVEASNTAAYIRAAGGQAFAYRGSIVQEDFCRDTVVKIERESGPVSTLINAAATLGPHGPFATIDMGAFAETISVNLMGTCNMIRQVLGGMERRGFGRIINFAGGGAAYAYPLFTAYGASKAAAVRLTETIAEEISVPDVTINIIAPGAVETDMLREVRRRGGEVRTVTDISEPVRLVAYLASADTRHINGRFIHVRDDYTNPKLFASKDMLKLRRMENR